MSNQPPLTQNDTLEQILTHLEFLGYSEMNRESGFIAVKHSSRPKMCLRQCGEAVLFTIAYGVRDLNDEEKSKCFALLNKLNEGSVLSRFYLNEGLAGFYCEGAFFGEYKKTTFSGFIERWFVEISTQLEDFDKEVEQFMEK